MYETYNTVWTCKTWAGMNWPGVLGVSTADWGGLVLAGGSELGFGMAARGRWDRGTASAVCAASESTDEPSEETKPDATVGDGSSSGYLRGTSQIICLPWFPFACAVAATFLSPFASLPCSVKTRNTKHSAILLFSVFFWIQLRW